MVSDLWPLKNVPPIWQIFFSLSLLPSCVQISGSLNLDEMTERPTSPQEISAKLIKEQLLEWAQRATDWSVVCPTNYAAFISILHNASCNSNQSVWHALILHRCVHLSFSFVLHNIIYFLFVYYIQSTKMYILFVQLWWGQCDQFPGQLARWDGVLCHNWSLPTWPPQLWRLWPRDPAGKPWEGIQDGRRGTGYH